MLYLRYNIQQPNLKLNLDVEIPAEGICALFGHSGAGKTTILRILAGLEPAYTGIARFKQKVWQDQTSFVPPYLRKIGYVFQDGRLFNHLTVKKNLDFASSRANLNHQKKTQIIEELGISNLLHRMPHNLSGGEKQRVVFARCLLAKPQLLLLDEPFNAVDIDSTRILIDYIKKLGLPTLYVSHDREEITKIADYILHIDNQRMLTHGNINQMLSILGHNGFVIDGELLASNQGYCSYQTEIGLISFATIKPATPMARLFIDYRNLVLHKHNNDKSIPVWINTIENKVPFYSLLNITVANQSLNLLILEQHILRWQIQGNQQAFMEIIAADIL